MEYAFNTKSHIVFVMKFIRGGDLFFHLQNDETFDEERTKFYVASIALCLAYLHS